MIDSRAEAVKYQLSAEMRLLVACSWIAPSPSALAQNELVTGLIVEGIDWERFIRLAHRHQLQAVAANGLARLTAGSAPATVTKDLGASALVSWQRAVLLSRELLEILGVCAASGVDVIPLKGNVLASKLFGDPGVRNVLDIDLLVRYEELDTVHQLLVTHGYERTSPGAGLTPRQLKVFSRKSHHWVYRNAESGTPLELHWRVFRWTPEQTRLLWERSHEEDWLGVSVRQFDDSLLLLSLCDHGSQHRYNRLKWLSDIVTLIARTEDWNWSEVLETAKILDLELPLAQACLLIRWLYGDVLPTELVSFAEREPIARKLATESLRFLSSDDASPHWPKRERAGLKNTLYWVRENARTAWYSTHLRKHVPLSTRLDPVWLGLSDFESFPLPDRWFWLYYPLRPFFLVYRCFRGG